jgi:ubiquinone/menaquinone biosynthesis C-methylase UbiE
VARRTGARLVGTDFSEVAVTIAHTGARGFAGQARFCVGDYTAIGSRDHSVDAVMCIDAVQFSDPPLAALREFRRILARGGRLAITAWEPAGAVDSRLSERIRRMNLVRDLPAAGFSQVEVSTRPDWHEAEHRLWESVMQADADDDPALVSLQEEGKQALETFDVMRRVFATATAP